MEAKRIPWARITAEFVAILCGVTLALLADDWREYRNDRQFERAALVEILRDLEADSAALAAQRRRMRLQNDAALWAQGHFGMEVPGDSALNTVRSLWYFTRYQAVRSGYVGLRDSGQMSLIVDLALRQGVVHYYEVNQPYMLQFSDYYWQLRDRFTESLFEDVLLVGDTAAEEIFPSGFDLELRRPWREFSDEIEFKNRLMAFGGFASNWGVRIEEVQEANRTLRALIQAQLEGHGRNSAAR
jgi:hypothetical protein